MELRKTFIDNEVSGRGGFTLIEVLVVLSLITIVIGSTLFFDINMYRGEAFRAERENLVIALQTARANALNNINQHKHGVAINPGGYEGYVVFEGNDYASSDPTSWKEIPSSYNIDLDPNPVFLKEVVFSQLSGDVSLPGDIKLLDPLRNTFTTITVNHEGKIGS